MIKEKRKEKHYTQEQMANLLGISLRQYVRIDQEEDLPRRDVLKKLSKTMEFFPILWYSNNIVTLNFLM